MPNTLSVSLEGLDGSGKSTAAERLRQHYVSRGRTVVALTSPSRRPGGLYLRQNLFRLDPEEKDELFMQDLKDSQAHIPPEANLAIWDRHVDSIYTSNPETNLGRIGTLSSGLVLPDMTCYLKLGIADAYDRATPITDHELDKEWLNMKYERYEELSELYPDRITTIDASQSVDDVLDEIINKVEERL